MKRRIVFLWLFLLLALTHAPTLVGQEHQLNIGLRCQKAIHLYWENGVAIDYTHPHLWKSRVHLGLSYCTSRLGTAFHSNAIKQDNYLLYAALHLRKDKLLQPIIKLNSGFFYADMEYEIFEVLPHKSPLLSCEAGLEINPKWPLKLFTSLGYNFITGDGVSGPGTLYPVFYQISLLYAFTL